MKLVIVSLVALLVILLVVILHTDAGQRRVLELVQAELAESQNLELEASKLDYNLLLLEVSLRDVSLRMRNREEAFLSADRIHVDFSAAGVPSKILLLERVVLDNLSVNLIRDANGEANWPEGSSESETPADGNGGWQPRILSLDLTSGSIAFEDRAAGYAVSLPRLSASIRGHEGSPEHDVRIQTGADGQVTMEGRTVAINRLDVRAGLDPTSLDLRQLLLEAGGSRVEVSGEVNDFDAPQLDLTADLNLNLPELTALAGIEEDIGGTAQANLRVRGTPEELAVDGTLESDALAYRGLRNLRLSTGISWGDERLELSSLNFSGSPGEVTGTVSLALGEGGGESSLNARLRRIDVPTVGRLLDLPVEIATRLNGEVEAKWDGMDWQTGNVTFDGRLREIGETASANRLPVAGEFRVAGTYDSLAASLASLRAAGAEVKGTVHLARLEQLDGQIDIDADTGRTLADIAVFLDRAGEFPEASGQAHVTADLGGTVSAPTATVTLSAPQLAVAGYEGIAVAANADYTPEELRLPELKIAWQDQELAVNGSVGFQGQRPIEINARVDQAALGTLVAAAGQSVPVDGRVTLDAQVRGTLDAPAATVSISGDSLRAYNEDLGALEARAIYQDNVVELTGLELVRSPENPDSDRFEVTGRYNIETKAYELNADVSDFVFDTLTLPGDVPLRGVVGLNANGSGSVDEPGLDLTLTVRGLDVAGHDLGNLSTGATIEGEMARAKIQAPALGITTTASLQLRAPHPIEFQVVADGTDLARLEVEGPGGELLTGEVAGRIEGSGPLETPLDGSASAELTTLRVRLGDDAEVENQGPVRMAFSDGRLAISSFDLRSGGSSASISGALPLESERRGDQLNINASLDLAELAAWLPSDAGVSGDGSLEVSGSLGGSLRQPEPAVTIAMSGEGIRHEALSQPLTGLNLEAVYENDAVVVRRLNANLGETAIEANGEIPVRSSGEGTFHASVRDFHLSLLNNLPERVDGTATLQINGALPNPSDWHSIEATARFDQLDLELLEYRLAQEQPVELAMRNGVLEITSLQLNGPNARLTASGSAGVSESAPLDLHLSGEVGAGILALASDDVQATGETRFELTAAGTMAAPDLSGFLELDQGGVLVPASDLTVDDIDLRVELASQEVKIAHLTGTINGGPMSGAGSVRYSADGLEAVNLALALRYAFFEIPEGLQTQVQATIVTNLDSDDNIIVGGRVTVLDGSYRERLDIQGELFSYLEQSRQIRLQEEQNALLSRIRLNLDVETRNPISVRNNLMQALIEADLTLHGNPNRLGMTGRLQIQEGSELYLNERDYLVESGVVTFVNERAIQPELNIVAQTEASGYDITLQLSGGEEDYSATFTSDPSLPEPDIISVLLTGRTLDQTRGAELNIAKEQALSYLSGQAASRISSSAARALGISRVRIEPNLIAAEENPGARLTVGQDITNDLRFTYSMNLVDSSDQIQIVEYDVTKRFLARGTRQEDNSARFDIEHGFQFGGPPPEESAQARGPLHLTSIEIEGDPKLDRAEILDRLGLEVGDEYDFIKVQNKLDKLRRYYRNQERLEALVRPRRDVRDESVDLTLRIEAGPKVDFVYEGYGPSGSLRKDVRGAWSNGFSDRQRQRAAERLIDQELYREGFFAAEVASEIREEAEDSRQVLFTMRPGTRFENVEIVFSGADSIDKKILEAVLDTAGGLSELRQGEGSGLLLEYYRQEGFLSASVAPRRNELDVETRTARVVFDINEGPRFTVRGIEFSGNHAFDDDKLLSTTGVPTGAPYEFRTLNAAVSRLEELYWGSGYQDVGVAYSLDRHDDSTLAVRFEIDEGEQQVVESISVEGTDDTSEKMVRNQLEIGEGKPLDYRETGKSRRNLYNLGAYSLVEIKTEPRSPTNPSEPRVPVAVQVKVRERDPFDIRYGFSYDSDRGPGFIVDATTRNILGAARTLGGRVRYDPDFRELRGYISQPLLRRLPLKTNVSGYTNRTIRETFITDRIGFSVNQEYQPNLKNIFSYGYRFERTDTFDKDPDSIFQVPPFNVAPLTVSWTRETRDELLDATRGSFLSQAFEYAPDTLGSDIRFVRYFGQYFKYVPLKKPAPAPFGGGTPRPRFVYATAVRVGLGKGLGGQDLIESERFFAGGSTTLRGFPTDSVGPEDFLGPLGGDAMFLTNNEIRFPIFKIFDGVGFLDMGNVYRRVGDFDPTDLRKSAGFGLRIRTGYLLLRVDYGFILDPKPGEPTGGFHFSIGQAF